MHMNASLFKEKQSGYDPGNLFDTLIRKMALQTDAELAGRLGLQPHVIAMLRSRQLPLDASVLLRMHDVTGISLRYLRVLLGDRRDVFRSSGHD
jgi:hypothetical protein